jgi:hypothetical protein
MSTNMHVPDVLAHRLERIAEQEGKSVNRQLFALDDFIP